MRIGYSSRSGRLGVPQLPRSLVRRPIGNVKLRLTAVSDPQHGGFTAGSSPVSCGSIDELFVNLTVPPRARQREPYETASPCLRRRRRGRLPRGHSPLSPRFWAIFEFPKWRKYLISLSFLGQSMVRPVQVGGFDVNIVIHRSTAVRGRGGPARHDAWPPSLGAILAHTDGPCGS